MTNKEIFKLYKHDYIDELYYCDNEHSDNYGVPTFYDDSCVDFEER